MRAVARAVPRAVRQRATGGRHTPVLGLFSVVVLPEEFFVFPLPEVVVVVVVVVVDVVVEVSVVVVSGTYSGKSAEPAKPSL